MEQKDAEKRMQIFSKRKQADNFNLEIYKKNKQLK